MIDTPKNKHQNSEIESNVNQPTKESSSWWKFLVVAIPAYTYFFGYCSKKYYLEGLGFDSPEISGEPGSIYEFAFNSFMFLNSESLKNAWPMYIKSLEEGWIQFTIMSLLAGLVLYVFSRLAIWYSRRPKNPTKDKHEEIKQKTFWVSVAVTIGSFIANLAMIPAVILGMTLVSMMFLPAPLIGYAMASNEINDFTCIPKSTSLIEPCATVSIDEGESKVGNILHTDSNFLYIFTKDGAEAIPLENIKHRLRPLNKTYSKAAN
jgi:uncharacterized membrane protein